MKKKIILIVIVILSLLGLVIAVRHSIITVQMREAQEMVNNIRRAVSNLGGTYTTYIDENGFPAIEYTLETSRAIINLAGLEAVHGISQADVVEVFADRSHPQYPTINNWVFNTGYSSPQSGYTISLGNTINDNLTHFQTTFPDEDWDRWSRGGVSARELSVPVIQEAIRLEAEQRAIDER